jgi:hypothetical protein
MAATDISALVRQAPSNQSEVQPVITRVFKVDFSDSRFTGITGQFAHPIAPIPLGEALIGGCIIVTTDITGASGTITWQIGSDTLSGLMPVDNLEKGDVHRLLFAVAAGTESKASYAHTAADTLDMDVNTTDITAGVFLLVLHYIDVATILAQGEIAPSTT